MAVSTNTTSAYKTHMEAAIRKQQNPRTVDTLLKRVSRKIANTIEQPFYDLSEDVVSKAQLDAIRRGGSRLGGIKLTAKNTSPEVRISLEQLQEAAEIFENALDSTVKAFLDDLAEDNGAFWKSYQEDQGIDRRMVLREWAEEDMGDNERTVDVWVGKVRLMHGGLRQPKPAFPRTQIRLRMTGPRVQTAHADPRVVLKVPAQKSMATKSPSRVVKQKDQQKPRRSSSRLASKRQKD